MKDPRGGAGRGSRRPRRRALRAASERPRTRSGRADPVECVGPSRGAAGRVGADRARRRRRSYSTRRFGRPITAVKRLLVRLLRQYVGQMTAQQSRFNAQVAAHVMRLEERVRRARGRGAAATSRRHRRRRAASDEGRPGAVRGRSGRRRHQPGARLPARCSGAGAGTARTTPRSGRLGMTRRRRSARCTQLRPGGRVVAGATTRATRRAGAGCSAARPRTPAGLAQRHPAASTSGPRPGRGGALPARAATSSRELAGRGRRLAGGLGLQRAASCRRTSGRERRGDPGAVRPPPGSGPGAPTRRRRAADRSCSSGGWSRTSARTW